MQRSTRTLVVLLAVALAGGCDRPQPAASAEAAEQAGGPRIVSLSPALSRTLLDFGLEDQIVGRSAFCRSIDQSIPVVGDLYDVDYERLIRLEPTHILVQPPSAGLDPRLKQFAGQRGWTIGQWTIDSIGDIEETIRSIPGTLYGPDDPRRAEASRRAAELLNRIASAITAGGGPSWSGSTLIVASTEPVLVVGRHTYLHDILSTMGARNAIDARGWVEISLEDILRLDPEAMIIVREHAADGLDPVEAAGPIGKLDTRARRAGRIAVLRHPDVNMPSSGVIGVAAEMRRTLRHLAEAGT